MSRCPSITAPDPALMDTFYIDPSTQDSRQNRSRSNSHLSSTAAQFQGLNIHTPPPNEILRSSSDVEAVPDFRTSTPPTFLEHPSYSSPNLIQEPAPQQLTPFPPFSESDLNADWSYLSASEGQTGSAPLLRLDPAQSIERSSIRSNSNPSTMR
jgi:hypothetical protein